MKVNYSPTLADHNIGKIYRNKGELMVWVCG
jgi:hypothetical protein